MWKFTRGYVATTNIKQKGDSCDVNVYSTHGVYGQDNLLTCRYGRCFLVCFYIYLSFPAPISLAATVPDGLNDDNSPREEAQEGAAPVIFVDNAI